MMGHLGKSPFAHELDASSGCLIFFYSVNIDVESVLTRAVVTLSCTCYNFIYLGKRKLYRTVSKHTPLNAKP